MRTALFVEGSDGIPSRDRAKPCRALWCETIAPLLGLPAPNDVIPISKGHLDALFRKEPAPDGRKRPARSGAKEPLDQLMGRLLKSDPFDVAIVAWDLVPKFSHLGEWCRWRETLDVYRLLGQSDHVPERWRSYAAERHLELSTRPTSGARLALPRVDRGATLVVCMEPMFEALFEDDGALRRALNMYGVQSRDWPKHYDPRRVDKDLIGKAIAAAQNAGVKLPVHGGFQENKDAWGEYLFRALMQDAAARHMLLEHPIVRRLREVMRPASTAASTW